MEKKDKRQFSFSTYEAYQKIRKNDPLKLIFEAIDWSFIDPMIQTHYHNRKELLYSPVALFKAQLLIYLGEVKSNRDLAEVLRFNTKYCLLCGFHHFLKTPAHSTFSSFRKRIGPDLFHKIMHRIMAQSIPIVVKKLPDISIDCMHISVYSKEGKWLKCNCRGKCKLKGQVLAAHKTVRKKNFVSAGFKVKLFIDKDTDKPFAAEISPKA